MKTFLKIAISLLFCLTANSFSMDMRKAVHNLAHKWNFLPRLVAQAISERFPGDFFSLNDHRLVQRLSELCNAFSDEEIIRLQDEVGIINPWYLFEFWQAGHNITVTERDLSLDKQINLFKKWAREEPLKIPASATHSSTASVTLTSPLPKLELIDILRVYARNNKMHYAKNFAEAIRTRLQIRLNIIITDDKLCEVFDAANRKMCPVENVIDGWVQEQKEMKKALDILTPSASSTSSGESTSSSSKFIQHLNRNRWGYGILFGGVVVLSAVAAAGTVWYLDKKKKEESKTVTVD